MSNNLLYYCICTLGHLSSLNSDKCVTICITLNLKFRHIFWVSIIHLFIHIGDLYV